MLSLGLCSLLEIFCEYKLRFISRVAFFTSIVFVRLFARPLETAQENAQRLTGKPDLELPFPECCATDKAKFTSCSLCGTEYCSVECQSAAYNQYHRILCLQTTERNNYHPLEQLNEAWKYVRYSNSNSL
jgi:hypothetical protein